MTAIPLMLLASGASAAPLFADGFTPGRYSLRVLDGSAPPVSMCLANADLLARPEHRSGSHCVSHVLSSEPNRMTIRYRCPGQGWGRSVIRRETSDLFQIDTQGISGKEPFAVRIEARRVGACEKPTATSVRGR